MLPDINLLPKYERQNSLGYILFMIGMIVCLLLLVGLIILYFYTRGTLEETNNHLTEAEQEQAILEERLASLEQDDQSEAFDTAVTYIEQQIVPTSYLINELIVILPDQSYLSSYDYTKELVTIEAQFETMSDTAAYVEALNKSEVITSVQVDQIDTFELESTETEEEQEEDSTEIYQTIPRYDVSYTLEVNHRYLREKGEEDE